MSGAAPGFGRALTNWVRRAALSRGSLARPAKGEAFQWKIVKGDTVVIRTGKDAGKSGKVKSVMRKNSRLVVAGLHTVKRAVKATELSAGGIIAFESPIHYSRVALVDPADGRACRVRFQKTPDGKKKLRVSLRSGQVVPWPSLEETYKAPLRPAEPGLKDTPAALASQQTYVPPPHLRGYLSPASSAAATDPALVSQSRPKAGSISIFRNRKAEHGDRVPFALGELKLRRKDRLKMERKEAKKVDERLTRQINRATGQGAGAADVAAAAAAAAGSSSSANAAELR